LVSGAGVCVHETMQEFALLAQASQARLGKICKDAYHFSARDYRSGGGFLVWVKGHLA